MIRALSTAASGMDAQQTRLDVTANNIANVSTAGFKKSRAEFQDLMYQTIRAPGNPISPGASPTGLSVGMGVRTVNTQRDHSEGDLRQTGNPLDVAIEGRGFFVVTLPNSGDRAYTRDGAFKLNADGHLVTADGNALATDITVPPDATSIHIAADGAVSAVVPSDKAPVELGRFEVATFVNPAGLSPLGRNLYLETAASGTPVTGIPGDVGIGTLSQGTLELSNVKVVEEMVDLIAGQRAYEVNSRVIKAADEMLQNTVNLR